MSGYLKSFTDGETILADETNSNNQYLLGQINSSIDAFRVEMQQMLSGYTGDFIKPGFIIAIPHNSIPTGYLKCDGSSLLRTDYTNLFNAIGTIYGYADSTHFNLPDFQGVFLRGYGGKSATIGTKQLSAAPNITGTLTFGGYGSLTGTGPFKTRSGSTGYNASPQSNASGRATIDFSLANSNSIYGDYTEIRPSNYAVNWIIKY